MLKLISLFCGVFLSVSFAAPLKVAVIGIWPILLLISILDRCEASLYPKDFL